MNLFKIKSPSPIKYKVRSEKRIKRERRRIARRFKGLFAELGVQPFAGVR